MKIILTLNALFLLTYICAAQTSKNTIKTGISSIILGDYSLSYERVVNSNSSVHLKLGYWTPSLSPLISGSTFTPGEFSLQKYRGGISPSVEYRFFMKKDTAPRGFYIAPYIRYIRQNAIFSDQIKNKDFNVNVLMNLFGAGGVFGYQLILKNKLTFDFQMLGLGLDRYMAKFRYTLKSPDTSFDYASITDDVDEPFQDINYFHKRISHTATRDNHSSRLPFLFPGIRIGVSAGLAF